MKLIAMAHLVFNTFRFLLLHVVAEGRMLSKGLYPGQSLPPKRTCLGFIRCHFGVGCGCLRLFSVSFKELHPQSKRFPPGMYKVF